jgi:urease accessory protein UreF
MLHQAKIAPETAVELLGDLHPLMEQLGSLDGLVTLADASDSLQVPQIKTLPDFRNFLKSYHDRILSPVELPFIRRAFSHACHNQLREMIALDQEIAREPVLQNFASASRRVGQGQLQRLRPLRDDRLVQRYLAAVDRGEAHGWHTLVYGLTLAVYSLPLRQGLFGYAHQTTRGFIHAASETLELSRSDSRSLFEELCAGLPATIESLLAQNAISTTSSSSL